MDISGALKIVTSGNLHFPNKKHLIKYIAVDFLGKHASNFIKNEPYHRLQLQIWDQLFNWAITFKKSYIWYLWWMFNVFLVVTYLYPIPPTFWKILQETWHVIKLLFQNLFAFAWKFPILDKLTNCLFAHHQPDSGGGIGKITYLYGFFLLQLLFKEVWWPELLRLFYS